MQLTPNEIFIVVTLGGVLVVLLLSRLLLTGSKPPYEKRTALVTKTERYFFDVLQDAVDGRYAVFAMVRLADVIRVIPKTPQWQSWQNKIHAKHLDFVICDWDSLEILVAIELDDPSHERADRVRRDRFVESALDAAEIPLLRVKTAKQYKTSEIRRAVQRKIDRRKKVA